jgi:cell division protein FtsB
MNRATWPEGADSEAMSDEIDGLDAAPSDREPPRRSRRDRPARHVDTVSAAADPGAPESLEASLRALPVAGVSRRRLAWIAGAVVTIWVVAVFARQVGDASAAADRAAEVRAQNNALAAEVAALERERDTLQQRSFVEFQARAFGLGNARDRRFTLTANAPSLAPDAPGSASVRLGSMPEAQSPLDSWLSLLFGPTR